MTDGVIEFMRMAARNATGPYDTYTPADVPDILDGLSEYAADTDEDMSDVYEELLGTRLYADAKAAGFVGGDEDGPMLTNLFAYVCDADAEGADMTAYFDDIMSMECIRDGGLLGKLMGYVPGQGAVFCEEY